MITELSQKIKLRRIDQARLHAIECRGGLFVTCSHIKQLDSVRPDDLIKASWLAILKRIWI